MHKNILLIILGTVSLYFTSCENKKTEKSFNRVVSLKSTLYEYQPIIPVPYGGVDLINDEVLVLSLAGSKEEHQAILLNVEDGTELGYIGKRGGHGPFELMDPFTTCISEEERIIKFHCANMQKEVTFAYDDKYNFTPKEEQSLIIKGSQLMRKYYLENYRVGGVFWGYDKPYVLLNKDVEVIENFGESSLKNKISGRQIFLMSFFDGYENDFISGAIEYGYLAYYTIKDGVPLLKWEHYLEEPIYDSHGFLELRDLSQGITDVEITKNYVFCTYVGIKNISREMHEEPKTIFVFDRNGNQIVKLKTDRNVSRFTVSKDEKTIYAVSATPEIEVMRYDISDIL